MLSVRVLAVAGLISFGACSSAPAPVAPAPAAGSGGGGFAMTGFDNPGTPRAAAAGSGATPPIASVAGTRGSLAGASGQTAAGSAGGAGQAGASAAGSGGASAGAGGNAADGGVDAGTDLLGGLFGAPDPSAAGAAAPDAISCDNVVCIETADCTSTLPANQAAACSFTSCTDFVCK